jgi:hypothetical protein
MGGFNLPFFLCLSESVFPFLADAIQQLGGLGHLFHLLLVGRVGRYLDYVFEKLDGRK